MSKQQQSPNSGSAFLLVGAAVLIALKLLRVVHWSWWVVTIPLWGFALLVGIVMVIGLFVAFVLVAGLFTKVQIKARRLRAARPDDCAGWAPSDEEDEEEDEDDDEGGGWRWYDRIEVGAARDTEE